MKYRRTVKEAELTQVWPPDIVRFVVLYFEAFPIVKEMENISFPKIVRGRRSSFSFPFWCWTH